MKRCYALLGVLLVFSMPLFAQVRLDMGIEIPRGVGAISGNEVLSDPEVNQVFNEYILPVPELGLYYQFGGNALRAGVGLRMYTFILASIFWPNAFIEADVGPLTLQAQLGGGLFGLYALGKTEFNSGKVLLPDLSLWYRWGKSFRLGGGAIGLLFPESTAMGFLYYIGGKFSILFK
ncbi:hypothetical protein [Gracilinema caldarium]|uniref:hypothetical protein n=1 Tax=Gracilinema caldarium TaxID=215591 RepID=UPI0026EC49C4|nr:hypothetical protein [Gracilinema caldarium]